MLMKRIAASVFVATMAGATLPASAFTIKAIRFVGLSNVPEKSVLHALPISVGDDMNAALSNRVLNALFQTGFFNSANLYQSGNTLIIQVQQRPTIAKVSFSGNELIKKDDMQEVLNKIGLTVGSMFNETTLNQLKQSLEQEYIALGKYAVRIKADVTQLPRNRVGIKIKISEGLSAKILRINIVGNTVFDTDSLEDQLAFNTPHWFSFLTGSDKYTKQKLNQSLEALNKFYMDRGYIHFHTTSSEASVDPTRRHVYITISVHEGHKYTFSGYQLAGYLILPESEIRQLITVQKGDVFSRQQVMDSAKAIQNKLKDMGYAFANVNTIPKIDEKNKTVAVQFVVSAGHKVTINHVSFSGNTVTRDRTLRERIKYVEGSVYSGEGMDNSKIALERLPYLKRVAVQTSPVVGKPDQLNVNYDVTEQSANSVSANVSYSELNKVILGGSLQMPNVFGTGNIFNINTSVSRPYQSLSVGFTQPYFTINGVSQSFSLYATRVDNAERDLTNYSTNSFGGTLSYAIPISTWNFFNAGVGYDHTKLLQPQNDTSATVAQFTQEHGTVFNTFTVNFGWSHDTTNSAYFPTRGLRANIGSVIATPISKMKWYKVTGSAAWYHPIIAKGFTLGVDAGAGYANGYGSDAHVPFYNNFYGGGWGSGNGFGRLRGFAAGSLGPDDKLCNNGTGTCSDADSSAGNSIGGNLVIDASMNLYFPVPFAHDQSNFRMGWFVDVGNVYLTYKANTVYTQDRNYPRSPSLSNLRYSTGISFEWKSPFGPLAFSLAQPLNKKSGDNTELFQFSLGQTF